MKPDVPLSPLLLLALALPLCAIALALTSCRTSLAPEHSRERILNLGIVSWVERIESRALPQPAPASVPAYEAPVSKGPYYVK